MYAWLKQNSTSAVLWLAIAVVVLLVAVVVLLVLWLLRRRAFRRLDDERSETEWTRIDRELALAEQAGRLRIIRELQDIAIQSVSRLIARAEGARYAGETDPEAAVRATAALAENGRDALSDMRRVLSVVREGEEVSMPAPGLHSARELFRVMRDAGLVLSFTEDGERFPLKQGAELSIFRILQGTLENALTHGGAGTDVHVSFTWTGEGLHVTVDDDGIRSAARRAGLNAEQVNQETQYTIDEDLQALTESISGAGLTEMRERAQVFGGILSAKTVPGIGFSVSVVFPSLRFHNGVHAVDLSR
jgi:signal transduction histidine kinase